MPRSPAKSKASAGFRKPTIGLLLVGIFCLSILQVGFNKGSKKTLHQSLKEIKEYSRLLLNRTQLIKGTQLSLSDESPDLQKFEESIQMETQTKPHSQSSPRQATAEKYPGIPNLQLYKTLHKADIAVLDLLDWEETSRRGLNSSHKLFAPDPSCNPPPGVRDTCCLGSFSSGGMVNSDLRHRCASALAVPSPQNQWIPLKQSVRLYMANTTPIIQDTTATTFPCDICQIVELARTHSLNISLMGDSMHAQVFEGFICELQRRRYVVEQTWEKPVKEHQSVYQNFGASRTLRVKSPAWDNAAQDNVSVQVQYHMLYMVPVHAPSEAFLAHIMATSQILFLGFGLHWKYGNPPSPLMSREAYGPAMGSLFQQAFANKVQLLAQRETSTQHFDIPGGDYVEWDMQKAERSKKCVFLPGNATGWRERAIQEAAPDYNFVRIHANNKDMMRKEVQPREVITIPYHEFTQQLTEMHPVGGDIPDCTHYCGSPYMYLTIWRSLRLAMDRQYSV